MAVLTAGCFLMHKPNSATDAFTGDGTQTTFTLAKTPKVDGSLVVKVNGTEQGSTAYTVSGKVVTFTTAPADDAVIVVVYDITSDSYEKLCDISQFPDMGNPPEGIDVTTLSDWCHKYIAGLIDTGGNLEFNGFLDATTLPLVAAGTSGVEELAFWVGGQKSGNTITPTGSILKIEFEGTYTAVLGGGGADEAIPVTIAVAPNTVPTYTAGTMNVEATQGQ